MPTFLRLPRRAVMIAGLAAIVPAGELAAQQHTDRATRRTIVAVTEPTVAFRAVRSPGLELPGLVSRDSSSAIVQDPTPRSRSRGARRGLVIGLIGGALLGLVVTNDFLDEPAVNMVVSAGFFGLVGAGVGALVGAAPESGPGGEPAAGPQ